MIKKNKGYTLVELMIVVAILGVIATLGPNIFINITRFERLNSAQRETQRGARESLAQINRNIRQANSSTIVVSNEPDQPPYSSVSFSLADGRSLKYYQSGKTLYVASQGSTTTLCGNLRHIAFSFPRSDDLKIMSISVTFEKDTYEGGSKALQMAIEKVRIMND